MDDRTVLSPELVLVSPDLWEVALERLPPVPTTPRAPRPPTPRAPRPLPPPAPLAEPPGRTGLSLVLAATAYVVLTIAARVAVGVGGVLGIVLVLMLLRG